MRSDRREGYGFDEVSQCCIAEDAVEMHCILQMPAFICNPFTDKIFYSVALRIGLESTPRLALFGVQEFR